MNDKIIQDYIKAGKAVIAAKKLAKKIIKPGISFLEIANKCEEVIIKNGVELSFPINISLNEIAAHYSPPIDDKSIIPEKGLLKIDLGSHYNGYIADSAFTINLDEDTKLQNYVDAAEAGLNAAIELFKPGTRLYELGEVIANEIIKRGLRPVTNLGGHELGQYNLHAGPFIPNYKEKSHNNILKPGDAYACEPFSTSGVGKVMNGKNAYIFRFIKKKTKNVPYDILNYMNKIKDHFGNLPFSPRWIEKNNLIPKSKIKSILNSFISKNIIDKYPTLIERTSEPVAQFEHTILINMDGETIVTTKE
ncbi:MAG: type II methionyl aminopeptidase [Candidatus Lokiarchaeota archaeon]|nr:type II methionyl aminopeptidase [Candidatus Lokiarchaeota archaeon]